MDLTDGTWLLLLDVATDVGVAPDGDEASSLDLARRAAAAQVERARPDLLSLDAEENVIYVPTPDVYKAAVMLTSRLYHRKGSPTGLASYGDFGPAAVPRFDADIERLLGVGRYARPLVG